ncbi:MAG: aminopeptidase [Lachnospiraceae bacterium]|nr:aminopeptidase [Lachnospiraceae bacterium]MBP5415840.1 aminopeptidase [Lachnospiraceae bacterium]MBP5746517.1 aminopeptidase [Lachnospiraceae bacterium]
MSKNVWVEAKQKKVKAIDTFAKEYCDFLNNGKTERECTDFIVNAIEKEGYVELEKLIKSGKSLKAGDKVYAVNMNKSVIMFNIGKESLENGMNILGAHIDSPRLDLKSNPLYEDTEIAYLDTHYYGGVKKYQWVTLPLALHGVVVKKDLSTVEINIGEDEDDPVFFISDLLIHLASEQMDKKGAKVIEGDQLDVIVGSMPLSSNKDEKEKEKEAVKANILKILKDNYDIEEDDFHSAEIEVVPAGRAREAGFDRSMILGYGHDDRVCAFPSFKAMIEAGTCERTACCILVDKEEIGSVGATGMRSQFFENTVAEIMALTGASSDLSLRRCLANSNMLSSDVSAAFDPTFASSFDKKNSTKLGHGIVLEKYTGARGKSGSNDANAEYLAKLRAVFEKDSVTYQTGELGKVDVGGGGTIAYILALYGMNVTDCGVPVLNMHAPWECISKADLYEAKCGYVAFLKNA